MSVCGSTQGSEDYSAGRSGSASARPTTTRTVRRNSSGMTSITPPPCVSPRTVDHKE
jgi:hypothetical protein